MGKIKLGYLTEGFDSGQAPIKNLINLAKYHDKDIFDITFFSRWTLRDDWLPGAEHYEPTIELIKSFGCEVVIAPFIPNQFNRMAYLYDAIKSKQLDIFCTYVMRTEPICHALCEMRVASVLVKDVYQQPEFSELPDLTIHYSPQSMKGDIGKCIYIPQRWIRPQVNKVYTKSDFNIPEDATVLVTTGRQGQNCNYSKFEDKSYWSCITTIIEDQSNAFFLGIGCESESKHPRIMNLGFRDDVFDILQIADIYIDTWPLGGGLTLAEAIFADLPIVMFDKNEDKFDPRQTTLPEILNIPELTIQRWWRGNWVNTVKYLIRHKDFYGQMKQKIMARGKELDRYEDFIKEKEKALLDIYNQKMEAINGCKT